MFILFITNLLYLIIIIQVRVIKAPATNLYFD